MYMTMKVLVAHSCLNLCNSRNCSLLGSSVHGVSQARTLAWVAIYVYMYIYICMSIYIYTRIFTHAEYI